MKFFKGRNNGDKKARAKVIALVIALVFFISVVAGLFTASRIRKQKNEMDELDAYETTENVTLGEKAA